MSIAIYSRGNRKPLNNAVYDRVTATGLSEGKGVHDRDPLRKNSWATRTSRTSGITQLTRTRNLASCRGQAARFPRSAASAAGGLSLREPFFSWRRLLAIGPRLAETSWRDVFSGVTLFTAYTQLPPSPALFLPSGFQRRFRISTISLRQECALRSTSFDHRTR